VAPFYLDTLHMAQIQIAPSPKHNADRQTDRQTCAQTKFNLLYGLLLGQLHSN